MVEPREIDDLAKEAAAKGLRLVKAEAADTLDDMRQDPGSFLIFGAVVATVAAFIGYVIGKLAD